MKRRERKTLNAKTNLNESLYIRLYIKKSFITLKILFPTIIIQSSSSYFQDLIILLSENYRIDLNIPN